MHFGSGSQPPRVAVIGTGVLGASVGWNLQRQGADVTFLDAAQPGQGVSRWSFSWVNASNKTVSRPYFDLNVAGMAAHRELAGTIGADSWWHPVGHLRWTDEPAAEAKLLETVELLAAWDYNVEVHSGTEVRRLEPAVAVPDEARAVFYPDEAWVHGRNLVTKLVDRAVLIGAKHRFGTAVRGIDTHADGGVRAVVLADGRRLEVDAVVNAAGPAAADVAALLARQLPMRWEPGAVARIACPSVPVGRPMHAPHIEIRPHDDTSLMVHSREVDALIDAGTDPAELGRLLHESARHVIPGLAGSGVAETHVSNRPIPADGFPSVGGVPSVPGYYEAVSHSGITLGPVLGRLLAAEILGGVRDELLAEFRPERFPR
jgi:glycine/D-amino acid oxidase-like deaminating enzyme